MSVDQLHYKSITELSELFRRGEVLPSEVTEATLSRIAKLDGSYHGYAVVLAERAMAQARKRDSELAKGIWRGPLHGVPIGLKDLCYTTFAPTAGGTRIHAKFVPSFNATIVDRLERAGAVTLGKLKMTEGAYTSHHPLDQAPLNPWNVNYCVGSSSSRHGAGSAGTASSRWRTPSIISGRCAGMPRTPRPCWASSRAPTRTIQRHCRRRCRTIWPGSATASAAYELVWIANIPSRESTRRSSPRCWKPNERSPIWAPKSVKSVSPPTRSW